MHWRYVGHGPRSRTGKSASPRRRSSFSSRVANDRIESTGDAGKCLMSCMSIRPFGILPIWDPRIGRLWRRTFKNNYLHFDGFVVITGTDTMAYCATALSFMLENLGKPVVFTGSQIQLNEPYNDARRNLIMAIIFASRDTIFKRGVNIFSRSASSDK
jgi:hypothetical protein